MVNGRYEGSGACNACKDANPTVKGFDRRAFHPRFETKEKKNLR